MATIWLRIKRMLFILLIVSLLSALMLFFFLPQQPFFASYQGEDVASSPSSSPVLALRGRERGKEIRNARESAKEEKGPELSRIANDSNAKGSAMLKSKRKVAVSIIVDLRASTLINLMRQEPTPLKAPSKDPKKEEPLEEKDLSSYLADLRPLLRLPTADESAASSVSSSPSSFPSTEILLMVHITSTRMDQMAASIERLLDRDPFIRVIRIVQKNSTLVDTKEQHLSDAIIFKNACNQGAKHARGKYLIFLSDAVVAEPGWLPEFYQRFSMLAVPKPVLDPSVLPSTVPLLAPAPSPASIGPLPPAPSSNSRLSPFSLFESKAKDKKEKQKEKEKEKQKEKEEQVLQKQRRQFVLSDKENGGRVSMLGCKVIRDQTQQIHSAGLGVSLVVKSRTFPKAQQPKKSSKEEVTKQEKKKKANWWDLGEDFEDKSKATEEPREVLSHYKRLTGYHRNDTRATQRRRVLGPSSHCFAISRNLFLSAGGMKYRMEKPVEEETKDSISNSSSSTDGNKRIMVRLDPTLQVLDLSLRLKEQKGLDAEYAPTLGAVRLTERGLKEEREAEKKGKEREKEKEKEEGGWAFMYNRGNGKQQDGVEVMSDQEFAFFERRKSGLATVYLEENAGRRTLSDVDLVWDFYGGCTGWGLEAVSFFTALEDHLKVLIVAGKDSFCHGFPDAVQETLNRIRSRLPRADQIPLHRRIPNKLPLAWPQAPPSPSPSESPSPSPSPSTSPSSSPSPSLYPSPAASPSTSTSTSTSTSSSKKKKFEAHPLKPLAHTTAGANRKLLTSPNTSAYGNTVDRVTVWVSHKPPNAYPKFPYSGLANVDRRPDYVIGRSMTETNKIPGDWVHNCNNDSLVDEIWVPANFLIDVFHSSGVRKEKLRVVPIPIDVHFWDPEITQTPLEEVEKRLVGIREGLKNPFNFLSVFKWEKRKGWDILLQAYWSEFKREENTTLFLQTYLYGVERQVARSPSAVMERIESYAEELGLLSEYSKDLLPRVEVLTNEWHESEMPRLYKPFDAFVLPTRGEGFGMPMMEAMAMEIPTIATNWSGPADFMTADNSYPIAVEEMVPISSESKAKGPQDSFVGSWAKPSQAHLQRLMREVYTNREEAKAKAKRAREDVVAHFSQEQVAKMVVGRITEIEGIVKTRREKDDVKKSGKKEKRKEFFKS